MGSRLLAVLVALVVGLQATMTTVCLVQCASVSHAMHCHEDGITTSRLSAAPDAHTCAHADLLGAGELAGVGREVLATAPTYDVATAVVHPPFHDAPHAPHGSPPGRSAPSTPVPLRI